VKIASLVVRIRPEDQSAVRERLEVLPGVAVHGATPDGGRLIVLVEDGRHYAMTDSLVGVAQASGVLGVTLAYEYTGDETPGTGKMIMETMR
jgi:periplasmic nitrate reductase NapD